MRRGTIQESARTHDPPVYPLARCTETNDVGLHRYNIVGVDLDGSEPHATSTVRRTAEAVALRVLLTESMKGTGTPVVVLGDINDGQAATLPISSPNSPASSPEAPPARAFLPRRRCEEYRDTRDGYYTHVHQDLRESLDHVLVSEQFYDNSHRRLRLFDGLVINNDHLNFDNHKETGTGDHGVVKVSFRFNPV